MALHRQNGSNHGARIGGDDTRNAKEALQNVNRIAQAGSKSLFPAAIPWPGPNRTTI